MLYRSLGRTGIEVSEIGFGGRGIGGEWGPVSESEALETLNTAYDGGVNFFDTALVYGDGRSEKLIGKAFGSKRDSVIIADKIPPKNFSWPVTEDVPIRETFPADWIVECTEKSLKNLGSDYIDVQQLHAWTDNYMEEDEWLSAFMRLKQDGKIRAAGISANDGDPGGCIDAVKSGVIDTLQVIYNIFEQRPAQELFPAAEENDIGIIVRVPFEEGLLTGGIGPETIFEKRDRRSCYMTPERIAEVSSRLAKLEKYIRDDIPSYAALALKFTISHSTVSTVIPGMRRKDHVESNILVSDSIYLTEDELTDLRQHMFIHGWSYPRAGKGGEKN